MNKKKKITTRILMIIVIATFIISTAVVLAAPTIRLTVTTNNNTANLSWTNSDSTGSYSYRVLRSINDGAYNGLSAENAEKVKVLNIYPNAGENITFVSSADGATYTLRKAASLKMWMEKANALDSRGYGRGIIAVDALPLSTFNANPGNYLKKDASGKYNYDVIMFGTWDSNSSEDMNQQSVNVVKSFIQSGGGTIFGHDTLRSGSYFAQLAPYVNIAFGSGHTYNGIHEISNGRGTQIGYNSVIKIVKTGVLTTYPWSIGETGTILRVPACHSSAQFASGEIWLRYSHPNYTASDNSMGDNFFLTTYNNAAMIQTGHSSGAATDDEQKILANLIFYLADVKVSTNDEDKGFVDINKPNKPTIQSSTSSGTTGNVTYTATDNGTTYKYYIEAKNNATNAITTSNIETRTRTTGVAGYSYVIDTNEVTEIDNTIDTTSTSINYTIGNGPNTYLHIKAIDGAGNVGETLHILIHSNVPPELTLTQNKTEWTNGNVIITAVGTDSDGSVVKIKKPNGSIVNAATTTYEVEQNGTYEFVATDNSGATATKSITIDNIDKVKPNATTSVSQPTATVRGATINISATDDASGVAKIVKPDGTEVTSTTTTYLVTEPGTYTFKVIDVAGNEKEIEVPVVIVSDGVEVRYIDQVTKTEIETRVNYSGNVEESYLTEAKVIDGYELVLTPSNASGKFTIDKQIVTYEYRKNSYVTVKYIDENYNTTIIDDIVTKYKEGDAYTTEQKEFEGYGLVRRTYNTSGMIERENIVVEYRYKKISAGIEIKYIDQVTGEEIADPITRTGYEKTQYISYAKDIDGYELVVTPENANGEMTVDKITVIYEYRKNSYVTQRYIDENSGYALASQQIIRYKEGDTYTTNQLDIEGYSFTRADGNTTGTIEKENIIVTFYYKKDTSVTVKYVDMLDNDREIAERVVIAGKHNDDYTTDKKDIPGYTFVETSGIVNGKMKYNPSEVVYKYKKASKLITEHRDANTNEKIISDVEKIYKENEQYEAYAQNIEGYVLVQEPEGKKGVMGREDVIKTFYYKKMSDGLVVRYVDKKTNEELDRVIYTGNENDNIALEEKTFLGYLLDERPDYDNVILGADAKEITFYYKKTINLGVVGIDQETGEQIYETSVSGIEGNPYVTTPRAVNEYELVRTPENSTGVFDRENTKVIYEYRKIGGRVVVKYLDRKTNQELDTYTIVGKSGENYQTERRKFDNYNFVEVVGQEVGTLGLDTKEVIYYYEKKTGKVVVTYLDEEENEVLKEELTGNVGDSYNVTIKDIPGYRLDEVQGNTTGAYDEVIKEVIVRLEKIKEKGTVVVKYIDEEGNEILKEEITGNVGENYNVNIKNVPGYELIQIPENTSGKYEKDTIEVIVKVKKEKEPVQTGKIVVKYIDENGKEILTEELIGNVGDNYNVNVKNIPGYNIVEIPENKDGKYQENTIEVIIKVEKEEKPIETGTVVVKYIDENGKEILKEELTGNVGDGYSVGIKDIPGYNIVSVPTNTSGKYEKGTIEVIVKVEKEEEPIETGNVVVKYIDKNGREIFKEELTGNIGEYYHINVKEIEGYDIIEVPENTNGKYQKDTIEVIIKVEETDVKDEEIGKVIIKYVDENGNVIKDEYVVKGEIGKDFNIEKDEIDGYEIIGDKVIRGKFFEGELVFEAKYKKIDQEQVTEPFPLPETGDIDIALYVIAFSIFGVVIIKKFALDK